MKRTIAVFCLFLSGLFTSSVAHSETTQQQWKCYSFVPSAIDPVYQELSSFAAKITEASNGRLAIQCSVGGALPIKSSSMVQAVSDDVIQLGLAGPDSYADQIPVAGLLNMPGMINRSDIDRVEALLYPDIEKQFHQQGVKFIGIVNFPTNEVFGVDVFTSIKDLKDKKIRVLSGEQAELIKRLGAVPITVTAADVPSALQRGMAQGVVTGISSGGRVWHDMLHSILGINVQQTPAMLIINESEFDTLSTQLQDMIMSEGKKFTVVATARLVHDEQGLTADFVKQGMTITEPTDADKAFETKVITPYWHDWAKEHGPIVEQDLEKVLAEVQKKASH